MIPCRMALDRRTALVTLSFSLLACTPAPNDAPGKADGAPQPTVVCQHVRTLAAQQNTDEQVLDQIQRECVQSLGGLASRYESFADCVERATTSAGVVECEAALVKPPSLLAGASPTAKIENMCNHVIGLLSAEIPEMGQSVNPSQVEQLRKRCIEDAGKSLTEVGDEAFAKQSDCILAATNLKTLQACGGF